MTQGRDPARQPLPELVRPMLAVPGPLPGPVEEERFAYEMKWDGVRALVYLRAGELRVLARSDRDVTGTYPELAGLARELGGTEALLDGEVVAFDERGRPSFVVLQQRMHATKAAQVRTLVREVPVAFFAFDVLHLDGRSLLGDPYDERRGALEALGLGGSHWQTPAAFPSDGAAALATSSEAGLEGVVAKRRDSPYEPGRRSPHWVKVKNLRTQEVVLCGWKPGEGRREGGVGSLLLGVHRDGGLRFAGHVGTGFTDAALAALLLRLRALERPTSPFQDEVPRVHARGAHWVEPRLVGEVVFAEWTPDGRLRHPSWRGLRPDKRPEDVVPEG